MIHKVNGLDSSIHFSVVTDKGSLGECHGLTNTRVLQNITEDELLTLYRESDVLLLPIVDCTANNTLLEAMACGLPVLTNDVGGVRDYTNDRCAILIEPKNANLMADQLVRLLGNDDLRQEMSLKARENALRFDWARIADRMKSLYEGLFA